MISRTLDDWQSCGVKASIPGAAFSKSFIVAARKGRRADKVFLFVTFAEQADTGFLLGLIPLCVMLSKT
jgi:hypothetical protein